MDSKLGSNLSEVKGIRNGFRLVWSQTTELFGPPHLSSMIQLCLLMFLTLGVAQGMQLWYVFMPRFDNVKIFSLDL